MCVCVCVYIHERVVDIVVRGREGGREWGGGDREEEGGGVKGGKGGTQKPKET